MHEHRVIERMVAVLSRELAGAGSSGRIDSRTVDAATEFFRTYADRCHHGKEEDVLFRELASKNLAPDVASAMDELIADHVRGRGMVRALSEANARYSHGDEAARDQVVACAGALVEFYPIHIQKEDRYFFKAALDYFSDDEESHMLDEFDEFDRALIHEVYLALVERAERGTL